MLSKVFGSPKFWQTPSDSLTLKDQLRILAVTLIPLWLMLRRLFAAGYVLVGNDADLMNWASRLKFTRLWMASGLTPWWNPYVLLGLPNQTGLSQPHSLFNLVQSLTPSLNQGLNYAVALLLTIMALAAVQFFTSLRFSPFASVLSGLCLGGTGMIATQLFAGHLALFSSLCLSSSLLWGCHLAMRRSHIGWSFPAVLVASLLFCSNSSQGIYLVLWVNTAFYLLRAGLGSPDQVLAPGVWRGLHGEKREGKLLARVPGKTRLLEVLWTLLKLAFIYLLAAELATICWYPALAAGLDPGLDGDRANIFSHSAPPISCLTLFIPHLFLGAGQQYSWTGWGAWEGQVGIGSLATLLVALGISLKPRRDLLLPGLLLVAAGLLAVGRSTPFWGLYSHLDPLAATFEVPSRFYFGVNFGLALLLAWSLDALIDRDWKLPLALAHTLVALILGLLTLWLIGYYLDGSLALWADFLKHLQNDYNYSQIEPVHPDEYYVLLWTRYSAVCVMVGAAIYTLVRAPRRFRPWFLCFLILLDCTRFLHPYLNLRAANSLVPTEKVLTVLADHKFTGKISNQFDPLWNGGFGTYLYSEWNNQLAASEPETAKLLEMGSKVFNLPQDPALSSLNYPCIFNRFLGVQVYIFSKEEAAKPDPTRLLGQTTGYQIEEENWQVREDPLSRPAVYVARLAQKTPDRYRMLVEIRKDPNKVSQLVNFLDPANYEWVGRTVLERFARQRYERPKDLKETAVISTRLPDRVEISVELATPGMVILNEAWSPDWRVAVDDAEDRCVPCQLGLNRGVLVDAGRHKIQFVYYPERAMQARKHSWTCLVIACSLLLCLIVLRSLYEKASA